VGCSGAKVRWDREVLKATPPGDDIDDESSRPGCSKGMVGPEIARSRVKGHFIGECTRTRLDLSTRHCHYTVNGRRTGFAHWRLKKRSSIWPGLICLRFLGS